jgi:DnaJ like chaperone protein
MSWWGKIIGGACGYLLGGPLGALLGAAVGHQYDRQTSVVRGSGRREHAQSAFFAASFSVMGHLCKADGRISEYEIELARSVMDRMALNSEQRRVAMNLFRRGKEPNFPLDSVLAQMREECRRRPMLLGMFVEIQLSAALADGALTAQEDEALRYICARLGILPQVYERLARMAGAARGGAGPGPGGRDLSLDDAYAMLGVPSTAGEAEVKRAYRRLLSQHHPDKLAAQGLPEEMMRIANEKTQEIRRAYERIQAAREGA